MSVEVGTGYVSIVPSVQGFAQHLQQQITGPSAQAGQQAGTQAGEGFTKKMGGFLKGGMLAVGAAAGAVLVKAVGSAMEQQKSSSKLAAQLGLSEADSKKLGGVAGKVYAKGYGESFDDVNQAIRQLAQNGAISLQAPTAEIEKMTKRATSLAETFDQDLGGVARATSQLLKNGLAKDGKEAMDILTKGFQNGVDKSEDLLDTVNEYSTQFRDLGLTGTQAMGLLSQGLKAGARDSDTVADALKEFAIRAKDGSKTTAEGFTKIGLSAEDMAKKFAVGGPEAAKALDATLDRLRAIKDPAERSATAVQLFGTKAEDLQQSLFALDPSAATAAMGDVAGAADKMGETLHDNASSRIESFKRTMEQGLVKFIGGPVLGGLEKFATFIGKTLGPPIRALAPVVRGFLDTFGGEAAGGFRAFIAAFKAGGDDITSSGFAGVMERIGLLARELADLFMQKVVPVVRDLATAIATNVLPILQRLGDMFVQYVVPMALRLATAAKEQLAPILTAIGDFIRDRVIPAVQTMSEKIGALITAIEPVIKVVTSLVTWFGELAYKIIGWLVPKLIHLAGPIFTLIFDAIGWVIDKVGAFVKAIVWLGEKAVWLWQTNLKPSFEAIAAKATWLWRNALKPAIDAIWGAMQWVGDKAGWLWRNIFSPALSGIGSAVSTAWGVIKPAFTSMRDGMQWVADKVSWLWHKVVHPTFSWIGGKIAEVMSGVQTSFQSAKDGVERIWNGIKEIAASPVRFIIGTVYNDGIRKVWNFIASKVGLGELDPVPGFERGGVMPGYTPGRDNQLIAVGGGEGILRPELTRQLGPSWVHAGNAAARTGGLGGARQFLERQGMFGGAYSWGGIVDKVKGGIKSIPGVGDVIGKMGEVVRGGLAKAAEAGLTPVRALINQMPDSPELAKGVKNLPLKGLDGFVKFLKGEDSKAIQAGAGTGTMPGNPGAALGAAFSKVGLPYLWGGTGPLFDCSGLTQWAYRQLGYQLGRTTYDQVTQGRRISMNEALPGDLVFEHFGGASPSHVGFFVNPGTIWDAPRTGQTVGFSPMSNVTEIRRYLDPAKLGTHDVGGWMMPGVPAMNGTRRPEAVLTGEQWSTMRQLAANRATSGVAGPITLVVQDGPTLRAYVDTRVDAGQDRAARQLDLGPRGW